MGGEALFQLQAQDCVAEKREKQKRCGTKEEREGTNDGKHGVRYQSGCFRVVGRAYPGDPPG